MSVIEIVYEYSRAVTLVTRPWSVPDKSRRICVTRSRQSMGKCRPQD